MSKLFTLHSSDTLNAHLLPGTGKKLVISFAGVGKVRRDCPPPEFFNIASDGGKNTVVFISDKSRSWLNAPKLAGKIKHVIGWAEENFGTDHTVAIGNSMGGTMALLLSHHVPFASVTAISPQVSVDPAIVPEETRWRPFTSRISEFSFPKVGRLDATGTTYFVLHGDAEEELIHARRFPVPARGRHVVLPGYGHRLAANLRRSGHLPALMYYAMEGRERRVAKRLADLQAQPIDAYRPEALPVNSVA